jgi:hypothetical protein
MILPEVPCITFIAERRGKKKSRFLHDFSWHRAPFTSSWTLTCNVIYTLSLFHGVAFSLLLYSAVNIFPDAYRRVCIYKFCCMYEIHCLLAVICVRGCKQHVKTVIIIVYRPPHDISRAVLVENNKNRRRFHCIMCTVIRTILVCSNSDFGYYHI